MTHHTACDRVSNAVSAGVPPDPIDVLVCRVQKVIESMLVAKLLWSWRIPIPPPPGPERARPDELTTIPGIRDRLMDELILDALKNPAFGQGLFGDLQLSDVYTEVLRDFIGKLDATTKNLRADLEGLEKK